eukprot:TRINITY_DN12858_c1_g1_i1.p1 TRINITY_DN12858_c1_g1~~TRINITY_DN12858_c1_g1_i1.p1  ORF type:complete len:264 (+),score=66.31 TRINITY_DN12858_c1_g1_i1:142-933(+)
MGCGVSQDANTGRPHPPRAAGEVWLPVAEVDKKHKARKKKRRSSSTDEDLHRSPRRGGRRSSLGSTAPTGDASSMSQAKSEHTERSTPADGRTVLRVAKEKELRERAKKLAMEEWIMSLPPGGPTESFPESGEDGPKDEPKRKKRGKSPGQRLCSGSLHANSTAILHATVGGDGSSPAHRPAGAGRVPSSCGETVPSDVADGAKSGSISSVSKGSSVRRRRGSKRQRQVRREGGALPVTREQSLELTQLTHKQGKQLRKKPRK